MQISRRTVVDVERICTGRCRYHCQSVTAFGCVQVLSENQTAWSWSLFADSLNHPVLLAEGTAIVLLHPKGHAAVMEGVVAFPPYN